MANLDSRMRVDKQITVQIRQYSLNEQYENLRILYLNDINKTNK